MTWTQHIIHILFFGFTGWATIWIAVKMLFHPRNPFKILGYTLQGVFPKKQRIIAESMGRLVSKELFPFDEIEKKITHAESLEKLKPEIEAHIDNFLTHKLKDVFPMLAMFIGEKTINQLKTAFLLELESLFPVLMKGYVAKLQQDFDLEKIVTEKVALFSSAKLEDILNRSIKKELQLLQLAGAIFGILIGAIDLLLSLYML